MEIFPFLPHLELAKEEHFFPIAIEEPNQLFTRFRLPSVLDRLEVLFSV
jgi:hypothetical protein